jgi:hypothetical protein
MSIKATEGLAPEWYTPPGQDDDPNPARFHIKPLNGAEFGEVADYLEITPAGALIRHAGRERALALGLIEIRTHIVTRIINISYMGEDAEKN